MRDLIGVIEEKGPTIFTAEEILQAKDLFSERYALFFTPSKSVPADWIGRGRLDVTLPVVTPSTFLERMRNDPSPRFWVDLLQRATNKLRWTPTASARVKIVRYDSSPVSVADGYPGCKTLIDALKRKTSGRRDGRTLYYFGAIVDDGPKYIKLFFEQRKVNRPWQAKMRIIVEPARGPI